MREPNEEVVAVNVVEDEFDRVVVEHVRMVTSLIEGRPVSRNETLRMLSKVMRQHSIGRRSRLDYSCVGVEQKPSIEAEHGARSGTFRVGSSLRELSVETTGA